MSDDVGTRKLPVYLPEQGEVYARAELLRWMDDMGWSCTVIDLILYHDNPSPKVVRDLVYKHGPDRAYKLLELLQ